MNKLSRSLIAAAAAALCASTAMAHIAVVNLSTPISAPGQSTFGVANATSEIQFLVPHGCTSSETVPTLTGANLDTSKIEITVPAAIVTATTAASLRPSHAGEFGNVAASAGAEAGSVKFTWTKVAAPSSADDQLYRVSVRLKLPAAAATEIKKYQFLAVQYCKSTATSHPSLAAGTEVALTWGTANSPTLLSFPDKRKGFNAYTLHTTTVSDFTTTGTGTLASKLKSYFGDAAIVWFGKSGYSANPNTKAKITALAAKDASYSELGDKAGASLTATDTLWVKY